MKGVSMIKLEDFVSETIKQIISGVITAQEYAKEKNAKVNPRGLTFRTDQGEVRLWHASTGQVAQDLDFDVAVTTIEGKATKGGIGVFVGPIGVGSQGQSHGTNSSESRIKFKVPILLPLQE
jgi:hypothetical protein